MRSSPETLFIAGAFVVDTSGGHVEAPQWPGVLGPTGVREQGIGTQGLPRNLGDPAVSTDIFRLGTRNNNSPEPTAVVPAAGSKQDDTVVSPSEGNEARRYGRQGV